MKITGGKGVNVASFLADAGLRVVVTGIGMVVATPLGLGAAIYLSEYAKPRVRRIVKPILEILAAIPTVVYGYFALLFVTPLLQQFIPGLAGFNALGPGIVMGIMILPLVSSLSEDAMSAVPQALREGAYGVGGTKRHVVTRVVMPAALSGIVAAIILGLGRAIGETMIVALAAGNLPDLTWNPFAQIQTMTAYIVQAVQGEAPRGRLLQSFGADGNAVLFGTASFWEGVDVKGDALRLVVIEKLPFASPEDPLVRARIEHLQTVGGNAFRDYQLPEAALALKQGVGRLIRSERDFGVVAICDPRLTSRGYGKVLLGALPPMSRTREPAQAVQFLRRRRAPLAVEAGA